LSKILGIYVLNVCFPSFNKAAKVEVGTCKRASPDKMSPASEVILLRYALVTPNE